LNLSGKIALVTGASRGIGESLAIGLADHGTDVIICDLESESKGLANTHKQIEKTGKKCWSYFLDVTKKSQIQKMVSDILNDIGSIDILVNNAGILTPTSLEDIDEETWDSHFEVNTKGVLLMCQSVLPHMREKKFGRIINIASIAGNEGNPNASAYSASKAAVIGLTKSLGKETADKDIAVNCITPATAKTRILDQVSQEFIDYMISKIPRNRFVTVEEIASLITFLASKENSFTTAGVFDISGGRATYSSGGGF